MPYDFGDVVLVEYIHTSQRQSSKRPAIVINTSAYSASYPDVIVMPVTSQSHHRGAVKIYDWQAAGLLQESYVKLVVSSFESGSVKRKLGTLDRRTRSALRKAIASILGFKQAPSSSD